MAGESALAKQRSILPLHDAPLVRRLGGLLVLVGVSCGVALVPAAMIPSGYNAFGPPKAAALFLSALLVCAGLLLDAERSKALLRTIRGTRVVWWALVLTGIACLSVITAVEPRQALLGSYPDYRGLVGILAYLVIGAGALSLGLTGRGTTAVIRAVSLAGAVIGLAALSQRFGSAGQLETWEMLRVYSTLGNASNLGVFAAVSLPLLIRGALDPGERGWRILHGLSAGLLLLALLWSSSRGAWVGGLAGAVVGLSVFGLRSTSRDWSRRGLAATVAAVVVVGGIGVALNPSFVERVSTVGASANKTVSWRLSTWRSSAQMVLDRPFLGWGPNAFRFSYPEYQEAGQVDGGRGYQVVEAAHNLVVDTAVSFGVPGVFALALLGYAVARSGLRRASRADGGAGEPAAVLAALSGGAIALSFHYVTMDTGPLVAACIGLVAAWEVEGNLPTAQGEPPVFRAIPALGALLFGAALVAAAMLLSADARVSQALALQRAGAPWGDVSVKFDAAIDTAPFEPYFLRQKGSAATRVLSDAWDPQALTGGLEAYDSALKVIEHDAVLVAERANLLLAGAVASGDSRLASEALRGFESATRMDPNTGIPWAGRASALGILGRWDEAVDSYERAVSLSPRDKTAWRNLAAAYEHVGDEASAKRAARKAG